MQKSTSVIGLFVYPVKSLAGVPVHTMYFDSNGVVDDRRYMLINPQGKFISQRSHPVLATMQVDAHPEGWWVSVSGESGVLIADDEPIRPMQATVWKDTVQAWEVSTETSRWFSEQLDEYVHLVAIDEIACRVKQHQGQSGRLAFADGYPLLVANRSSLTELNQSMNEALSMRRFRPNVIVDIEPFAEYELNMLAVEEGHGLLLREPCVRCNVPSIEPKVGVFQPEIHHKLKHHLLRNGHVVFGMNAFVHGIKSLQLEQNLYY